MISPELLRRYPYFTDVSEEALKKVAMISEERDVQEGDILFREDEPVDYLYILTQGEVDIQYVLGDGSHQTVDTIVPGDLMVWSAIVQPHMTHSMGIARKPSRLVAISAKPLRDLLQEDAVFARSLLMKIAEIIASRLKGARVQLATKG